MCACGGLPHAVVCTLPSPTATMVAPPGVLRRLKRIHLAVLSLRRCLDLSIGRVFEHRATRRSTALLSTQPSLDRRATMVVCWSRMGLAGLSRPASASGNELHVCQSQYRTVNCELATSTWFTVSICLHVIDCLRGEAPAPAACLPALRSHRTRTITGVCATAFALGHDSLCAVLVHSRF